MREAGRSATARAELHPSLPSANPLCASRPAVKDRSDDEEGDEEDYSVRPADRARLRLCQPTPHLTPRSPFYLKEFEENDDDASSQRRRQLLAFSEEDDMKESFEHIPNPIGQVREWTAVGASSGPRHPRSPLLISPPPHSS